MIAPQNANSSYCNIVVEIKRNHQINGQNMMIPNAPNIHIF